MLAYNEITPKKRIVFDKDPYEVLASSVAKKNRQKPVNQVKLRNIISGRVIDVAFHQSDKVQEVQLGERTMKYLYTHKGAYWFCEPENPKERFELPEAIVGNKIGFLRGNDLVTGLTFQDKVIGLSIPIKMEFEVTEAPPAVRGNTAQGATKNVVLETGLIVTTPLFINEGDIVRINTETGEYAERVEKK